MELTKVIETIERFAPRALSDEFVQKTDGYDNSGLILKNSAEVKKILFALDFSEKAVSAAITAGADLIVTHHPAIYRPIKGVSDQTPFGRALLSAVKNGISVYSAHLNLDAAQQGIDAALASIFGKKSQILMPFEGEGAGYGRATEISPTSLINLVKKYKKATGSNRVVYYGNENAVVSRVASFSGGGSGYEELSLALAAGADVMVSADFAHHVIAEAVASGISVIAVTHYSSEIYGLNAFKNFIINHLGGLSAEIFVDEALL